MKTGICSITVDELYERAAADGLPPYRAKQITDWAYGGAGSFDDMTNLPKELRGSLAEKYLIKEVGVDKVLTSSDGTKKLLFSLADGERVEGVLMDYRHGRSVCVSTEAGCRMGCRFCASPPAGFCRGLTAGEILGQVTEAGRLCGGRVDSVVLMGIGEPLDNFDNVVTFLKNVSDPRGYKMSLRHVSLSTCGLADRIGALADYGFQLTLSVSLHAPDDATRDRIMPVNRVFPIGKLMAACDRYAEKTGRRICFEYALIKGVNDSPEQAERLAGLLGGRLCHVNLINYNPVPGVDFERSDARSTQRFLGILQRKGIGATLRRTLGSDLNASCGQLRRTAQTGRGQAEHSHK